MRWAKGPRRGFLCGVAFPRQPAERGITLFHAQNLLGRWKPLCGVATDPHTLLSLSSFHERVSTQARAESAHRTGDCHAGSTAAVAGELETRQRHVAAHSHGLHFFRMMHTCASCPMERIASQSHLAAPSSRNALISQPAAMHYEATSRKKQARTRNVERGHMASGPPSPRRSTRVKQ